MTSAKAFFIGTQLFLLATACSAGELASLVLEGHELHTSLRTRRLDSIQDLPPGLVPSSNPQLSTDEKFVQAIARSSSQGRLGGKGIRSSLYARYAAGERELGVYGLEAESDACADQRENALREIWEHNVRLGLARVHRKGLVLVVVWHSGVSPECWEAVIARLVERLVLKAAPPNKGMKLTKPVNFGASQLIPGVRRTG
jgi:hypothetical protein